MGILKNFGQNIKTEVGKAWETKGPTFLGDKGLMSTMRSEVTTPKIKEQGEAFKKGFSDALGPAKKTFSNIKGQIGSTMDLDSMKDKFSGITDALDPGSLMNGSGIDFGSLKHMNLGGGDILNFSAANSLDLKGISNGNMNEINPEAFLNSDPDPMKYANVGTYQMPSGIGLPNVTKKDLIDIANKKDITMDVDYNAILSQNRVEGLNPSEFSSFMPSEAKTINLSTSFMGDLPPSVNMLVGNDISAMTNIKVNDITNELGINPENLTNVKPEDITSGSENFSWMLSGTGGFNLMGNASKWLQEAMKYIDGFENIDIVPEPLNLSDYGPDFDLSDPRAMIKTEVPNLSVDSYGMDTFGMDHSIEENIRKHTLSNSPITSLQRMVHASKNIEDTIDTGVISKGLSEVGSDIKNADTGMFKEGFSEIWKDASNFDWSIFGQAFGEINKDVQNANRTGVQSRIRQGVFEELNNDEVKATPGNETEIAKKYLDAELSKSPTYYLESDEYDKVLKSITSYLKSNN